MRNFISVSALTLALIFSCNAGEFSGDGATNVRPTGKKPPTKPGDTPNFGSNELIVDDGGNISPLPDYTNCLQLPRNGKRNYGQCADNEVVVIVNDGQAKEMTCCPLSSPIILSQKADEKHVVRSGRCQSNEVLTGMLSAQGSGYCTKINTALLTLSAPVPSVYATGTFPGILGEIARSYNVSDTCICPEGTVAIGGHTPQDNTCTEQCVRIQKK